MSLSKVLTLVRPEVLTYLKSPMTPTPTALVLAAGLLYHLLNQASGAASYSTPFVVLSLILILVRAPGWTTYLCLFLGLAAHTYYETQVVALTPAHLASTRDRAAIATAIALSRGLNPWTHTPQIPVPATTGAASILFVFPFVKLSGNIAALTYLFWLGLFGFVAACDIRLRNRVFPPMAIVVMTGMFGFGHTMEWRLEELYFPYLFFALAYVALKRDRTFLTGFLLAIPPLCRVSYCFMVVAFLTWAMLENKRSIRQYLWLGVGVLVAATVILMPFAIVGRSEFWAHNFVTITKDMSSLGVWPNTNVIYRVCNRVMSGVSPAALRPLKGITVVLLILAMGWLVRRRQVRHPFWHVGFAAFLSHTIVWHSPLWLDYALIFMVPLLIAAALTQMTVRFDTECGSAVSWR